MSKLSVDELEKRVTKLEKYIAYENAEKDYQKISKEYWYHVEYCGNDRQLVSNTLTAQYYKAEFARDKAREDWFR